jgi:hypothetical protein
MLCERARLAPSPAVTARSHGTPVRLPFAFRFFSVPTIRLRKADKGMGPGIKPLRLPLLLLPFDPQARPAGRLSPSGSGPPPPPASRGACGRGLAGQGLGCGVRAARRLGVFRQGQGPGLSSESLHPPQPPPLDPHTQAQALVPGPPLHSEEQNAIRGRACSMGRAAALVPGPPSPAKAKRISLPCPFPHMVAMIARGVSPLILQLQKVVLESDCKYYFPSALRVCCTKYHSISYQGIKFISQK